MKIKHTLFVLVIGFILILVGVYLKIMHISYGNEFLLAGFLFKILGLFLLFYKIINHPKIKDFLNS